MAFNRTDSADLLALKTEVNNDPLALGYNPSSGNTGLILTTINAKNYTVGKPKISSALIRSSTTYDAYNTLTIDEQEWLIWMTGNNGFNEENVPVTTDLKVQLTGNGSPNNSIWATAHRSSMVAAMDALINVPGSRAEILFGYNTVISRDDWLAARDYNG